MIRLAGIYRLGVRRLQAVGIDGWPSRLMVAWLLVMVSAPILNLVGSGPVFYNFITWSVVFQAAMVIAWLARTWPVRRIVWMVVRVAALAWLAEAVGSATGLPFGAYRYTGHLQPQIADVPLVIPLAWLMMLPPAWAVARRLNRRGHPVAFILLSGAAFTAWDLFLDPQMVRWDLWRWDRPSGYFGIPWVNFLGWFLVSALITALVRPSRFPEPPFLFVYSLTWIIETIGLGVFWGMPGPALAGFVVMGLFVLLAWRPWQLGNDAFAGAA